MDQSREFEQSKEMIARYDEIISNKANKVSIAEIYDAMSQFVKKESFN